MAKKATGLSRRQIAARARKVTANDAARFARERGLPGAQSRSRNVSLGGKGG